VFWQYVNIVDPVLSSIEAIAQRCQQTLTVLDAAADDDDATNSYFHKLEASFLPVHTICFMYCTGFPRILESLGFFPGFSRPWKVLEMKA